MMFFRFLAFVAGVLLLISTMAVLMIGWLHIRALNPSVSTVTLMGRYWVQFVAALVVMLIAGWLIDLGDITKPGRR